MDEAYEKMAGPAYPLLKDTEVTEEDVERAIAEVSKVIAGTRRTSTLTGR